MTDEILLSSCSEGLKKSTFPNTTISDALAQWGLRHNHAAERLAKTFLALPIDGWEAEIFRHRTHQHPWYQWLANKANVREFAAFILENHAMPPFVSLVQRVGEIQFLEVAREAVQRNVDDERQPVPHADLMRRLILSLKTKAGEDLIIESFPSLINRILVSYYGYFLDPVHLIGSVFTTEVLAQKRLEPMKAGLERLEFDPAEMEFVSLHLTCDEHHSKEWSEFVMGPSVASKPEWKPLLAYGVASCLKTSARYLDDLLIRAQCRSITSSVRPPRFASDINFQSGGSR